ncbi:MAG: peroxiredoxin [Myxococcota bacterium]|jgi:peroxiredoxin
MRHLMIGALCVLLGCTMAGADEPSVPNAPPPIDASARAIIGTPAPDFVLPSTDTSLVRLSDFAGKTVVLEWFNPGCPFVKDVHNSNKMGELAQKWTAQDVVWIAINSGAPGKQGTGLSTNQRAASRWDISYPVLLDESGAVGQAYSAKTTPHMYVIAPDGTLAFAGAFSNAPLGNTSGGAEAVNYIDQALTAIAAGEPVQTAAPKPWGCSVKYGS